MNHIQRNTLQSNTLYAFLIGLVIAALVLLLSSDPSSVNNLPVNSKTITQKAAGLDIVHDKHTIATAWKWDDRDNKQSIKTLTISKPSLAEVPSILPFTEESVYKTLHAVKLDDHGNIIIDNDALNALNTALNQRELKLDNEKLEALQNLIKKGLPGNAGEQTAQIVTDYYHYLDAKDEFNTLYDLENSVEQTIDDYEVQYNELLSLRELYLGAETAEALFKTANANARYMFDSIKLEANRDLSKEEKKYQQAKITEHHAEKTIDINNWNKRFQDFSDEKQYILNSSISDNEKRSQLTMLMHQHFNYEELEGVHHLQLDEF